MKKRLKNRQAVTTKHVGLRKMFRYRGYLFGLFCLTKAFYETKMGEHQDTKDQETKMDEM